MATPVDRMVEKLVAVCRSRKVREHLERAAVGKVRFQIHYSRDGGPNHEGKVGLELGFFESCPDPTRER